MAIPSTGEIKFSYLDSEFGGGKPINLSNYYAGGSNVPSGASGDNGAVPTSGEISLFDFRGVESFSFINTTGGDAVSPDYLAFAFNAAIGDCRADFEIQTDGDIARYINNSSTASGPETDIGDWISPKSAANASDFQFRVGDRTGTDPSTIGTAVSIPTGAIASQSWNNLSSSATWYNTSTGAAVETTFTFQLKHVPSGTESSVSYVKIEADGTGA